MCEYRSDKNIIEQWIVQNVCAGVVPNDEGNSEGLVYNLLSRLEGSEDRYAYKKSQHDKLRKIYSKYDLVFEDGYERE